MAVNLKKSAFLFFQHMFRGRPTRWLRWGTVGGKDGDTSCSMSLVRLEPHLGSCHRPQLAVIRDLITEMSIAPPNRGRNLHKDLGAV